MTAVTPGANATAVAVGTNVAATFSTAVQGVGTATFILRNAAGDTIPATVSYNATTRTATLDPAASLAVDGTFTATLVGGSTAIRDAAGTPLASTSWTFVTGPAPTVTGTTPRSNATLVRRGNDISATFSEQVEGVNGTTNQWVLDPQTSLAAKTKYTVAVTGGAGGIRDLAGNQLATWTWQFTTGSF